MKILVTGACGQLGQDVCRLLQSRGIAHRGTSLEDLNVTDAISVTRMMMEYRPDGVIHCAAYTRVDHAETEPPQVFLVNQTGTENLARACCMTHSKLLYLSTDYVFPGQGTHFYEVEDVTHPLNVYGWSKLAGEELVRTMVNQHFIVRTSWAFGRGGSNFVSSILRLAQSQSEISVVQDQYGSPTYTVDLAVLLCDMIATEQFGTYHATNEGVCSWYEFAEEILSQSSYCETVSVRPILSADYVALATRPYNSRLSKASLEQAGFARLPSWQDALRRYLGEIGQRKRG